MPILIPGMTLPPHDKNVCFSPHVVLLGAGASRAACLHGDRNGRHVPLMNDLVKTLGVSEMLNDFYHQDCSFDNFETLYSRIALESTATKLKKEIEFRLSAYFTQLELPNEPTVYDYLVLFLRDKDIIATFNWDPFLLQAFNRNAQITPVKFPAMAFLHGNVLVATCKECNIYGTKGDTCPRCGNPFSPTSLLYPVAKKNYKSNQFISSTWEQTRSFLSRAYYLSIFGYSAPHTDSKAKALLLKSWKSNRSSELCQMEIIDIKTEAEMISSWNSFFTRNHYSLWADFFHSSICCSPRRSCEGLMLATGCISPMRRIVLPKFSCLDALHEWVLPLIEDEKRYENDKTPFVHNMPEQTFAG